MSCKCKLSIIRGECIIRRLSECECGTRGIQMLDSKKSLLSYDFNEAIIYYTINCLAYQYITYIYNLSVLYNAVCILHTEITTITSAEHFTSTRISLNTLYMLYDAFLIGTRVTHYFSQNPFQGKNTIRLQAA